MMERRKDRRPIEKVALVTAVPAVLEALTGLCAAMLPERALQKIRLKSDDINVPMERGQYVELIYIPVVEGSFATSSHESAAALNAALRPFDLVVDLCEFTALYRRGQTPTAEIAAFQAQHRTLAPEVAAGALKYRNFLRVIDAIQTIFVLFQGKVIRPRNITRLVYNWDTTYSEQEQRAKPALKDFSVIDGYLKGDNDLWSDLSGESVDMLSDALTDPADKKRLSDALRALQEEQSTLKSRVMITGYFSNLARMTKDIVTATEPRFTHQLSDIFSGRCNDRYLKDVDLNANPEIKALLKICSDLQDKIQSTFQNSGVTQHFVDQYQFSANRLGDGSDDPRKQGIAAEFRKRFTYLAAFIDMWDEAEIDFETPEMNKLINGWYMSNSSMMLIKDAMRLGGPVDVTSWGIVAMVTNSVGILPDEKQNLKSIRTAVATQLNALFAQLVPA